MIKNPHHEIDLAVLFEEPLSSWHLMVQHQTRFYQLQGAALLDSPYRFQTQEHLGLNGGQFL